MQITLSQSVTARPAKPARRRSQVEKGKNMNRLLVLGCCLVIIPTFAWSLRCYHCEYGTVSQCDAERGNKSLVLECTETNTQCFKQKISEVDSEDKLRQGCTNEVGCTIRKNSCAGSGDCTATCCGKDLCNHGTSGASNKGRVLIFLAIAITLGYHLCM